jgi:hypothetical protein
MISISIWSIHLGIIMIRVIDLIASRIEKAMFNCKGLGLSIKKRSES